MSFTIHGVGICGGIAIGRAQLVSHAQLEVAHYDIPKSKVATEKSRFDAAIAQVREDLTELADHIPPGAPPAEFEAFLNLHRMILEDSTLSEVPKELIASMRCNAEWALKLQMDALVEQFASIEDPYLRERKADIHQVVERVLKALLGRPGYAVRGIPEENAILVAHDLSPADVLVFKQHHFASFITDLGGATSHTAIVARSLNIPSVVALHQARTLIRENETLIVDGDHGVVIVNPDESVLTEYRLRQGQLQLEREKLKRITRTKTATLDQIDVDLHANIELPEDVAVAKENGATGIGLFRTEFLFLDRGDLPSEDEQFEAYRRVATDMEGMPVTIRTFDLGADKQVENFGRVAANPALGLRAIRLCLAEPRMFHHQLRAILRASHYGKVRILIPMLSSMHEIDQTLHLIAEARESLDAQGIPYDANVEVGGMIEVPAAALSVNMFMRKLDFVSIGTNDLIQYTLAIDRSDDAVAHLYDPLHPAVLELVSHIIRSANRAGKPVTVCGEMAGDVRLTRLLLGFGLRQFSMHPAYLLAVKQIVLQTGVSDLVGTTQKILRSHVSDRIENLLQQMNV
ncbi:MAG TPA: phosphoenolpyruvate--protein phosphotransferase [Burkholderiales bacterium]|nr:phosphoenolpyruvate--protein phosphotransferase [Burkholderiales bacterium]